MTFGKYQAETPKKKNRDKSFGTAGRRLSQPKAKTGLTAADFLIGGVIVGLGIAAGLFFPGGWSSSAKSPAKAVGSEPPPIARAYPKSKFVPFIGAGGAMMNLKMVQTDVGFDGIDSELHERCMKRVRSSAARYAEVKGQTMLRPELGAEFLVCSMRVYTSRFCESFYRQRLADRLREFLRAQKAKIALLARARSSNSGRMMLKMKAINEGRDDGVSSGFRPPSLVPDHLGNEVRRMSKAGYLAASDFGWLFTTVPSELKDYLPGGGQAACG